MIDGPVTAPTVPVATMYGSAAGIFATLTVMNVAKTPPDGPLATKFVAKLTLRGPETGKHVAKTMMYVAESTITEAETAIFATLPYVTGLLT